MYVARVAATSGVVSVPLTALHSPLPLNSEYNERWNLFTVGLLARSGALNWDFDFRHDEVASDGGWITLRMKRGDHDSDLFWSQSVEPVRSAILASGQRSLAMLRDGLRGKACVGELIAQNYSIGGDPPVRALASCNGCPFCRSINRRPTSSRSPVPQVMGVSELSVGARAATLSTRGRFGQRLILIAESGFFHSKRKLRRLIESMVLTEGVRLVIAPSALLAQLSDSMPEVRVTSLPPLFTEPLEEFEPFVATPVATLVLVQSLTDSEWLLDGILGAPLTVIIAERAEIISVIGDPPHIDGGYDLKDYDRLR